MTYRPPLGMIQIFQGCVCHKNCLPVLKIGNKLIKLSFGKGRNHWQMRFNQKTLGICWTDAATSCPVMSLFKVPDNEWQRGKQLTVVAALCAKSLLLWYVEMSDFI